MKFPVLMGATALALIATPALADSSPLMDAAFWAIGNVLWPLAGVTASVATFIIGKALLAAGNKLWDAISRGLDLFEAKTGIEVDAKNREALHSALETGLNMAVKRGAPILEDAIAAWVKTSVPGAIAHFGLTDEKLDALVDAKLGKATAAVVPVAIADPLALPGALLSDVASVGEAAVAAPLNAIVGALGAR